MPRKKPPLEVICCRIPETLDLDALLRTHPPTFKPFRRDVVAMLAEYWYRRAAVDGNQKKRRVRGRKTKTGHVALRSEHMQTVAKNYSEYLRWMEKAGVWECDNRHRQGKASKGYRWTAPFDGPSRNRTLMERRSVTAWKRLLNQRHREYEALARGALDEFAKSVLYFEHLAEPLVHERQFALRRGWITGLGVEAIRQHINSTNPRKASRLLLHPHHRATDNPRWHVNSPSTCPSLSPAASSHIRHFSHGNNHPYLTETVPAYRWLPVGKDADELRDTAQWMYRCISGVGIVSGWERAANAKHAEDDEAFPLSRLEATKSIMAEIQESQSSGSFRFSIARNGGRISSAISAMPSVMRSYLLLDGCNDLVAVDLSSSHLYFLLPLAREWDAPVAAVHQLYSELLDGTFYEKVASVVYKRNRPTNREAVKRQVSFALYSDNEHGSYASIKQLFELAFPDLWNFICLMKTRIGGKGLAEMMQRIEADFVTKLMPHQLRQHGIPLWTVHDCFIIKREHHRPVEQLLVRMGREYAGFAPISKTKRLEPWT